MNLSQDTTRHTCCHCQAEVLTGKRSNLPEDQDTEWLLKRDRLYEEDTSERVTRWILRLKHSPGAVREAALSCCPFFVELWESLSKYSSEELEEIELFFELEGVKLEQTPVVDSGPLDEDLLMSTPDRSSQELYDITECRVIIVTPKRIWHPLQLIAVSDWGMRFLLRLSRSPFGLPPTLLTFWEQMIPAPTMP